MKENDADCYQPRVKKTKAKELNNILSKHSGISSSAIQIPNYLNHIKEEIMIFEATQKCLKPLRIEKLSRYIFTVFSKSRKIL